MSSSEFKFNIHSKSGDQLIEVNNSQVEIDGGYEGDDSFILIEAKNYIADDFLIRQLYYPYRLWQNKLSKQVRPVFLTYSNGIFDLREYQFTHVEHYNSLSLLNHQKFIIREENLNMEGLLQLIDNTNTTAEPKIPFPQADSFERVINLCELLHNKGQITQNAITDNYNFDARQTGYYTNASIYLGLAIKIRTNNGEIGYTLTALAKKLFSLSLYQRQIEFIKLILSHQIFKSVLKHHLDKGLPLTKHEIVELMKRSNLYGIDSDSTYERRASTINSWTNWITSQINED